MCANHQINNHSHSLRDAFKLFMREENRERIVSLRNYCHVHLDMFSDNMVFVVCARGFNYLKELCMFFLRVVDVTRSFVNKCAYLLFMVRE